MKNNIVFTFDDILMNTNYELYKYLCRNYKYYGRYLNILNLKTKKDLYETEDKNLIESLFKDEIKNIPDADLKFLLINNFFTILYKEFYNDENIFINANPTTLAKKSIMNPIFIENNEFENIYIIVEYKTEFDKKAKTNFINKFFSNKKIKILYYYYNDNILECFKTIPKWKMLITDNLDLIENISKEDINHKEFLVPKTKYTKNVKPELKELIKLKNASLNFFDISK